MMYCPLGVRIINCLSSLDQQIQRFLLGKAPLLEQFSKRTTLDIGHHQVAINLPVRTQALAIIVNGQNMGMAESNHSLCFSFEERCIFAILLFLGRQYLNSYLSMQEWVFSQPGFASTAPTDTM